MADWVTKNQLFDLINALTVDGNFSEDDAKYLINFLMTQGNMEGSPRDMMQVYRGFKADLPNLVQGEIGFTLDTEEMYVGGLEGNVSFVPKSYIDSIVYILPSSNGVDDTQILNNALLSNDIVDLNGGTYYINQINLKTNNVLRNGTLVGIDTDIMIKASSANNIIIENLVIDGNNICETGVFSETSTNVLVSKCHIKNFITRNSVTCGIYYSGNEQSRIFNNRIENIIGIPDAIIGNDKGASRAVLFGNVRFSTVDMNTIKNVLSSDDGDGIHLNTSRTDTGNNIISQNKISNCESRMIKIQQKGNSIINNELVTDSDYPVSGAMRVAGISIYSSDTTFENNYLNMRTLRPIQIGAGEAISNISIIGNTVESSYGLGQACIVLSDSPLINKCIIQRNTLKGNATDRTGIDIRTYFKDVIISDNAISDVIYGVLIRVSDGFYDASISVREGLNVISNVVDSINHLLVGNNLSATRDLINRLSVTNNSVSVSSPISFAPNSVYLSNAQYQKNPIVNNNTLTGVWLDGKARNGTTASRPIDIGLGFVYFDTTLNKPLWWNGTAWVDSAGTTVT